MLSFLTPKLQSPILQGWGSGFRVQDFRVLGFRDSEFRACGFRVLGFGFWAKP